MRLDPGMKRGVAAGEASVLLVWIEAGWLHDHQLPRSAASCSTSIFVASFLIMMNHGDSEGLQVSLEAPFSTTPLFLAAML